ncbi:hypothetical protein FACS1894208_09220 [Clostridia bacterium]|nr:hypothetical protein FACS1894208_09220 [Clostridia bacterium]
MLQTNIFNSPCVAPMAAASEREVFGCCSRYRDCSMAGECVHPDADFSAACTYKVNLEGGRIFYTQNATGFSQDKYREIVGKVKHCLNRRGLISWNTCFGILSIGVITYHA